MALGVFEFVQAQYGVLPNVSYAEQIFYTVLICSALLGFFTAADSVGI